MKTIILPADTRHLYLDEVAHLIADYNEPEGPNDPDGVRYELAKIQAESELHQAATDGQLRVRHPGTHGPFPVELGLKRAVLLVPDVVAYLAERGMAVVMGEPEQSNQRQETATKESIDFAMLATRAQLIAAFGTFTGMDDSWFTNLKDTPKLKDARRIEGSGGKDSTEPLFCPYAVMSWLIDPKRKKGRSLSEDTGWRMLKKHFNSVYDVFSVGRDNTY